jgi:PAS domain S-box-containing protein
METPSSSGKQRPLWVAMLIVVLLQFIWDLMAPNGIADWVWYFIPMFLSGWLGGRYFSYGLAAVVSVLMLVAFYVAPQGIDPELALISRLVGIAGLWTCAVLIAFRKDTKTALQRAERALRMVGECNQILVRAEAENELLQKICQAIVEFGSHRMAWVGLTDGSGRKDVRVAAVAGFEDGYLNQLKISWDESCEAGRGPTGIALRTGEVVLCNDFQNDPRTVPWHRAAAERGYAAAVCLPLKNAGKNFGVLVLYNGQKNAFNQNELALMAELADDLAYGIHALRTAQAAAEFEGRQSRLRLELATEAAELGIWEWNVLTDKIQWSAQMFKIYGVAPTDDLSVDYSVWRNAVLPEEVRVQEAMLQATVHSGGSGFRSFRIRRANDGNYRHIEAVETVRRNNNGQVEWVLGTNLDITERKHAEAEIIQARDFHLKLLQNAPALIWRAGLDAKCDWFNQTWLDFTGRTMAQEMGDGWAEGVHPEDLPACLKSYLAAFQRREPFLLEYRLRRHDGEYRWILDYGRPIHSLAGEFAGYFGFCYDIHDRKQAEAALKVREEIFSSIVNQAVDAITLIDCETTGFVEFNAAACEGLGYTRAEFAKLRIADIQAEYDEEGIRRVNEGLKTPAGIVFETRHRHRNGSIQDVRVSLRLLKLRGHDYIAGIWTDITEVRRKENELRKLSLAVEQNPSSVVITDPRGNIEYVNHRFTEVTGYTLDEVRGQNPRLLKSGQQPAAVYEELWREITAGRDWRGELINRKKDGSFHTELVVIAPVKNTEGVITHFVAMKEDITERKRIEENHRRLATAVEQSGETIVITDTGGTILYANPAFEKTTGYTRAEAVGKNPRLLKSGKQDAFFYRDMWETLARGETWKGHFINQRKDGQLYEEDATISPIRDNQGRIVNYVAAKRDVTREMQLEAQFRQAQKMEAIGTLAGGIAHDFNNILMVIFGYASMLHNHTAKDQPGREMVQEILNAADRAKDLVQQILTFSRQREQKRQIVRLEPVIKEATKFLRSSLPVDIQAELNLSPDAPPVLADPTQIYQVVMNLATNAFHAMEGKPGRLKISLDTFTPDEKLIAVNQKFHRLNYARLTIADTGHGMDAQTLERIFEPFFTTKPLGKGTGLGLALVHGIIQSHDGIITVESQPGLGTTFQIYFPAQKQEDTDERQTINNLPLGRGERILVVDDEAPLTMMLDQLLKMLKYQPVIFNHPRAALAHFRSQPQSFDLVITDLAMPELNGLEVARQIHTLRADVPVMLVSGFAPELGRDKLAEVGIRELIGKPIALPDMAQALQRNLPR